MPSVTEVMAAASAGPLLEGVLIPLTNQGKLRVTYDWLYSSLNCDPGDSSDFVWILSKLDDTHVSLSPRDQHAGRTLYASVRDDLNWYVQVQAPYSADWITGVGRDEGLAITGADLLTISLQGFNSQYIAVNTQLSQHGGHNGYRLQSIGTGDYNARTFFVGISRVLQEGVEAPLRSELTEADIGKVLASAGVEPDVGTMAWLKAALT
jgi:hypothetical protein